MLLLVACTSPSRSNNDGGDTTGQYLTACEQSDDCASGLDCLCGLCTVTCDANDACDAEGDGGACQPGPASCDSQGGGSICRAVCDDAPDPGPTFCGDEQRRLPVPDAHGCIAEWACEDMNTCTGQAPVPTEVCGAGEEPLPVMDAQGCILSFRCGPIECPDQARPPCDDPVITTDERGCTFAECPTDSCPQIAAPGPDFCPAGQRPTPTEDERGCIVGFTCIDASCEDVADPGPSFCGDEQGREPVLDDAGCVVDWMCVDPICPEPVIPVCADGQVAVAVQNSAGCTSWFCEAAPSFACGDALSCDLATQYCFVEHPGQPGPIGYACQAIPAACADDHSCECLLTNTGLGNAGDCSASDTGALQVSVYYP